MISTDASTFEFCREWLLSSESFVRDAMLADELGLDAARDQVRERIYNEEFFDEANEELAPAHEPADPPPVAERPRCLIRTVEDSRRRVGTGTFGGTGRLEIAIEVMVPEIHRATRADETPAQIAAKFYSRKQWARQLAATIRNELHATSGLGSANGEPYLNGTISGFRIMPNDPEPGESTDWLGWVWDVTWN